MGTVVRRVVFLVNPEAGGGKAESRLTRVIRRDPTAAGRGEIVRVGSIEDACAALRGLEPGALPVAAGGDGTVALLASALHRSGMRDTPMAVIPLGTSNILARTIGLADAGRALRALARGTVRRIDVMRTSHPRAPVALVSVSGGFEGRLLDRYARWRGFGRPLAGLAALPAAHGWRRAIALELDGEVVVRAGDAVFSVGLYNTPYYVGGLVVSREADVADGWAESIVYRAAVPYWKSMLAGLLRAAPRSRAGVLRQRWRAARIGSEGPLQIDGEAVSGDALSVWIEPGALPVVGPATLTESRPPSPAP